MDRSAGDLQLIRFVRQYQYLYDTGSDNYKNVKLKDNTWKKIALALGLSVDVSKTRWKSLRTSYLRHCKLMACRKKESTKCRKWPLADELSFLNPFLVPTDYVAGTNGVAGGGAEEPEPLSEDAWARVYEEAKPQPMEAVAVRLEVEDDDDDEEPAAGAGAGTAAAVAEVVEDEEEDEDDDIEEIMEHHPPEEELREVFRPESNEARADSAGSDGSYSSMITLVEPDSVSRSERRPRGSAPASAASNGDGGRGSAGGGAAGGFSKRSAQAVVVVEDESRRNRDTTRDFFLYLADTVKTFPPYLQAQVKGKCFDAVNSAELSCMSRMGNATPRR